MREVQSVHIGGSPRPAVVQMNDAYGQQYLGAIEQVYSLAPLVKVDVPW